MGLRWVSVLFVDLVGFTSWSESEDPADVRDLLSGYFAVARSAVSAHGGQVEKFIGDAVMAVWGADAAHADDAQRAVRAALELVAGVEEFGVSRGVDLVARAGVVTGEVAAWVAEGEGLVTGDRVNTAARVQAAAEPGEVWVDDATRSAARDVVEFTDAGSFQVKGKVAPLRLWRAVRAVGAAGGHASGNVVQAPFVGRLRELGLMKGLFGATIEDSGPRIVVASGAQGAGKSRLMGEFVTYLDGLALTVYWHEGRCASYGSVAFGPWAHMVRQRFQLAQDAPKEQVAAALAGQLPVWVPDEEEREFVATRLGVLLGTSDVSLSQAELFAGWRLFAERLAAVHPVVMVFEDLHWADQGLLQFLEHLIDRAGRVPIFVAVTAQPELLERFPDWMSGRPTLTPLPVDPLPEPAMRALVDNLVPDLPARAADQVVAYAQGVPLYAVETVRALVDRGVIELRDGTLCLTGEVTEVDTPASLTGLIAARLDALPAAERDLLLGLAVLGTTFPRAAVDAVTEPPPSKVDAQLDSLIRKDILTLWDDPMSPDFAQFTFTQNLFRTVAYSLVTRRQRHAWHTRVADHLRAVLPDDGEDVIETIAAHYADAYSTVGKQDKEPLRQLAMAARERAGHRAGALGAPDTGEKHFHQAVGLAIDEANTARLTAAAAEMAGQAGRFEDALALFQAASTAHTAAGRVLDAARLAFRIGNCLGPLGRGAEAVELLSQALILLRDQPVEPARAQVHGVLGEILFFTGERDAAREHIEQAVTLGTVLELPVLAAALIVQAYVMSADGAITEAEVAMEAAVEVAHRHGKTHTELGARSNLGELRFTSDLPGAEQEYRAGLELAHRMGFVYGQAHGYADLALMSFVAGRWLEAQTLAERGIAVTPDPLTQSYSRLSLVLVHAALGQVAPAAAQLAQMEPLSASDDTQDVATLAVARAALALSDNRLDEALDAAAPTAEAALNAYGLRTNGFRLAWPLALEAAIASGHMDRARSLLNLVDDPPAVQPPPYLEAQHAHYRALLSAANGGHDTVEPDLRHAVDILSELGYPYWLAQTQADLARFLASQGKAVEAQRLIADAIGTLTRLGAQPALDAAREVAELVAEAL